MAIVQNPVTGRTRQKFGNTVFSKNFGKNTMRTKPVQVRNPKSTKQKTQRTKFSLMIEILRVVLAFVKVGFKSSAVGMSAFNLANKENIHTMITGSYPSWTIDWTKFKAAMGSLTGVDTPTISAGAGKKITLDWVDNSGQGDAQATDIAFLLIVNWTKRNIAMDVTTVFRTTGTKEFTVPATWVGDTVYGYIAFHTEIGSKTSDSALAGNAVVLT